MKVTRLKRTKGILAGVLVRQPPNPECKTPPSSSSVARGPSRIKVRANRHRPLVQTVRVGMETVKREMETTKGEGDFTGDLRNEKRMN